MKCVCANKKGDVFFADIPKPNFGSKQALTKTVANGICGTDLHLILGKFKGIPISQYPVILGHENVGRVVEVGSEVKGLKVGDLVLLPFVDAYESLGAYGSAWGASSEYCVVNDLAAYDAENVPEVALAQCVLPQDIDPVDAVMIVTLREVFSALNYFGVQSESAVAVIGSGPVALSFIKLCKLLGVKDVIGVVRSKEKSDIVKSLGADTVINSSTDSVRDKVREKYPEGIPYVIDAVGSEEVVNMAMELIADRGRVCCYGVPEKEDLHIDFSRADYNWSLIFQQMPRKEEEGHVHKMIMDWIKKGDLNLKDFISDYYHFSDALEAYEALKQHRVQKKAIILY